jgi:hypothetical protein
MNESALAAGLVGQFTAGSPVHAMPSASQPLRKQAIRVRIRVPSCRTV